MLPERLLKIEILCNTSCTETADGESIFKKYKFSVDIGDDGEKTNVFSDLPAEEETTSR